MGSIARRTKTELSTIQRPRAIDVDQVSREPTGRALSGLLAQIRQAAILPGPSGGEERIYLTGDLGCMSHDGRVEHLGRKVIRVKIKGHRVEVAEFARAVAECHHLATKTQKRVHLLYLEGKTHAAISRRIKRDVNTVRVLLRNVRLGMKECLERKRFSGIVKALEDPENWTDWLSHLLQTLLTTEWGESLFIE